MRWFVIILSGPFPIPITENNGEKFILYRNLKAIRSLKKDHLHGNDTWMAINFRTHEVRYL